MKPDPVSDLERQLRQDAKRVMATQNHSAPVAALLERHVERQRQRKLVRSAGFTLLAVVIPTVWVASLFLHPSISSTARIDKTTHRTSNENIVVVAPPLVPAPAELTVEVDPGTTNAFSDLVPILLVGTNVDGEQVFVPALYVPARPESVLVSQLSQVQQRAVRAVLGLEKPSETQMPF